jgi:hypothetical protein
MLKNLRKTFEKPVCFSQSSLWGLIKNDYIVTGHQIWNRKIPYIVTNAIAAAEYHAQAIMLYAQKNSKKKQVIVDYGAGIGQHAYYLAQALLKHPQQVDFQIIMAELSDHCIKFWETHPQLGPLIEQKIIKPHLLSGQWISDLETILTQDAHCHLIANYLLDSMPFEAYENNIKQGLSLASPRQHLKPNFQGKLSDLTLKSTLLPEPAKHSLTKRYETLQRYTIPVTAINFIQTFLNSSNGLFFVNDKTFPTLKSITYDPLFNLDFEGSFSTTVNIDAIHTLLPNIYWHQVTHNKVLQSYILSNTQITPPSLLSCADNACLFREIKQLKSMTAASCISFAKILRHDPFCLEIFSQIIQADNTEISEIQHMIAQCLTNQFNKPNDFLLLHVAKIYRQLHAYERSQQYLNMHASTCEKTGAYWLEQGILYINTLQPAKAINALNAALQDPVTQQAAKQLINNIRLPHSDNEN